MPLATDCCLMPGKRKRKLVVAVLAEAGSRSALKALQDGLQKGLRKPPLRAERRPTGTLLPSPGPGHRPRGSAKRS